MNDEELQAIRAREQVATPGPWGWFGNVDTAHLYLATRRWGRHFVMGFRRLGMQGAQPEFVTGRRWRRNLDGSVDFGAVGSGIEPAARLARYAVAPDATKRTDPSVYRGDITGFHNPDAEFIAHARQDVADLLDEVDRLRALLGGAQ